MLEVAVTGACTTVVVALLIVVVVAGVVVAVEDVDREEVAGDDCVGADD